MRRLAYLVTHPIQYQAPLLKKIACETNISLKVFFASDLSVRSFRDLGFGKTIHWDVPLLEGFQHEFLPTIGSADKISSWRPFTYGIAKRLKMGKFDALWVHGYARPQHWMAMLSAKRLGMKVLIRDEVTAISTRKDPIKSVAKKFLFRWLSRTVDSFLAIGTLNREYYRQLGIEEERIFAMPYAVDNDSFQSRAQRALPTREKLRQSLGLEPGRPIILFAGKLIARKRAVDLLEAYTLLIREKKMSSLPYLLYVGDGDLRARLQTVALQRRLHSIKFLGFKNQTELPALYDLCDVFVMPTVYEPWGLVVNEVMNAGRPVVISDEVGCGQDLVVNERNGLVFRACDVSDLCRALVDILSDRDRLVRMGKESLEIIKKWNFEADIRGLSAALETQ